MKRTLIIVICLGMMLFMCACGDSSGSDGATKSANETVSDTTSDTIGADVEIEDLTCTIYGTWTEEEESLEYFKNDIYIDGYSIENSVSEWICFVAYQDQGMPMSGYYDNWDTFDDMESVEKGTDDNGTIGEYAYYKQQDDNTSVLMIAFRHDGVLYSIAFTAPEISITEERLGQFLDTVAFK